MSSIDNIRVLRFVPCTGRAHRNRSENESGSFVWMMRRLSLGRTIKTFKPLSAYATAWTNHSLRLQWVILCLNAELVQPPKRTPRVISWQELITRCECRAWIRPAVWAPFSRYSVSLENAWRKKNGFKDIFTDFPPIEISKRSSVSCNKFSSNSSECAEKELHYIDITIHNMNACR